MNGLGLGLGEYLSKFRLIGVQDWCFGFGVGGLREFCS